MCILSLVLLFATPWTVACQAPQIQKDKNTQLPFLKIWEQKVGIRIKSRVLCMAPAHNPTKEWADHLSHPSNLTPGHTSTLTPQKE